jgi:hypothetical protein
MTDHQYEALIDVRSLTPSLRRRVLRVLFHAREREAVAQIIWLSMLIAALEMPLVDAVTGRAFPLPAEHLRAVRARLSALEKALTVRERLELAGVVAELEGLLADGIELVPRPE